MKHKSLLINTITNAKNGFDTLELMSASRKSGDLVRMQWIMTARLGTFNFKHLSFSAADKQRVSFLPQTSSLHSLTVANNNLL